MTEFFRNSRLIPVVLAAAIATGVLGLGSVALAQEGDRPTPNEERGVERHHRPLHFLHTIRHLLNGAGVTPDEIRQGATDGLTWGEIIDQYGDISAAEAKANALAAFEVMMARAVESGRISQERADELLAAAPEALDRLLASSPGDHFPPGGGHGIVPRLFSLETVAEVLGIEVERLKEDLKAGQSIADIAGDQTQAVIDALVRDATEKIDAAVAAGTIDAARADELKGKLPTLAERFVNAKRPGLPRRLRDGTGERPGPQERMAERFGS